MDQRYWKCKHAGNISKIEDETLAVGSKDVFDHITKQDMFQQFQYSNQIYIIQHQEVLQIPCLFYP